MEEKWNDVQLNGERRPGEFKRFDRGKTEGGNGKR